MELQRGQRLVKPDNAACHDDMLVNMQCHPSYLTLATYAQRGLQYLVCVCLCVWCDCQSVSQSVPTEITRQTRNTGDFSVTCMGSKIKKVLES